MRAFAEGLITLPLPFVVVLGAGLVCWRWPRLSRTLFAIGSVGLILVSMPVVGLALIWPLTTSPLPASADIASRTPVTIVIPTAGIFNDGMGRWWASSNSIRRMAWGLQMQGQLGLPILVSGGKQSEGEPAEAEVLVRQFGLSKADIQLEVTSRNSFETGLAVAEMVRDSPSRRVLLVTSEMHTARMAAALRHGGLEVVAVPVENKGIVFEGVRDFLPSARGLGYSAGAVREYVAILWYLVTGKLNLSDLAGG